MFIVIVALVIVVITLIVIVSAHRFEASEQAVGFTIRASAEIERTRHSRPASVAKRERPETGDHNRAVIDAFQQPAEFAVRLKRHYCATAEITDQQFIAVPTECFWRERHTPGRIDRAKTPTCVRAGGEAAKSARLRVENIDQAVSRSR